MIIKTKDGWKKLGKEIDFEAMKEKPYEMATIKVQSSQAAELLKKWENL